MRGILVSLVIGTLPSLAPAQSKDGNRLAYLDEVNPYYPSRTFPKLITPQWVGEPGVEAVVILAIDDMREPKRYEAFLRPTLRRLKQIDGRAPLSIMTNSVDPKDPQLQAWLKEGLSIECHTIDHPCPFFKGGFDKAKKTYDDCVDLMNEIPNNKPVAFRMPCCDSLNTPSPRFYAEIFNKATKKGNFLSIDTSVFNLFTAKDPELPRELVLNSDGTERFRKYLPADRSFVNYIEDYPYPYVIGRLCWQFPCVTPSDWQANHLHKPNNPLTVKDWKAVLDCTVIKQGVFCLVFHPHGWIRNDQLVDFIDYAVQRYGKRVKFLSFREAQQRIDKNLLVHHPLRSAKGIDNGTLIYDHNLDGYLDVRFKGDKGTRVRVFEAKGRFGSWRYGTANVAWNPGQKGLIDMPGTAFPVWNQFPPLQQYTAYRQIYVPRRLHTNDPLPWVSDELMVVANKKEQVVFGQCKEQRDYAKMRYGLPTGARLALSFEEDTGLRFIDLDADGKLDIIFSNEKEYGIYLFNDMKTGWSRKVMAGKRSDANALPMISRNGTNNGFWVHSGSLWWANEDTVLLKDHVDRRSIKKLLGK